MFRIASVLLAVGAFAAVTATQAVGTPVPGFPSSTVPHPAHTVHAENYVAFGDSVAASGLTPTSVDGFGPGLRPWDGQSVPSATLGCFRGGSTIAEAVAERSTLTVIDHSCNGAVAYNTLGAWSDPLRRQIWDAIAQKSLNKDTQLVSLLAGFNDLYRSLPIIMEPLRTQWYVDTLSAAIADIRSVAPQAKIAILGYPQLSTTDRVCLFDGTPITLPSFFLFRDMEFELQGQQRLTAERTQAEFIDVKARWGEGSGACAPAPLRDINSLQDIDSGPIVHPTARGIQRYADELLAEIPAEFRL